MGGHTPGPWRLRPYQNDSHHLSGRRFGTRYGQGFTQVQDRFVFGFDKKKVVKDAQRRNQLAIFGQKAGQFHVGPVAPPVQFYGPPERNAGATV
jgi:hypothetical protein